MKTRDCIFIQILIMMLFVLRQQCVCAQAVEASAANNSPWRLSLQYLGLTWHPEGGTTAEIYPLKFDKKAYLVLCVGAAANLDYHFNDRFFFRFITSMFGIRFKIFRPGAGKHN